MKRNKFYIGALAAALLVTGTSCINEQPDDVNAIEEGIELEFEVNIPGVTPETRAIILDDTQSDDWGDLPGNDPRKKFPIKTTFEADMDALYLFEDGVIGERGIFTATENGQNITFKGRFKGKPSQTKVLALYPAGSYGAAQKRVAGETFFNMDGQMQVGNNTTEHLAPYLYMTGESTLHYVNENQVQVAPISLHHETVMYKFVFTLPNNVKFNNALDYSLMENRVELAILGNSQTYEQRMVKNRTHRIGEGDNLNRATDHSKIHEGDKFRRQILDLRSIEVSPDNTYTFYMVGLPTLASPGDILEVVLVMGDEAYVSRKEFSEKTYMEAGKMYTIARDFSGSPAGQNGVGNFAKASVFNNKVAALTPAMGLSDYSKKNVNPINSAADLRALIHAMEKASGDDDTWDRPFALTTSIHVTTNQWAPIGGSNARNDDEKRKTFRGQFNGNNKDGVLHGIAVSGELRNTNEQDIDKTPYYADFGLFGGSRFKYLATGANCIIENVMVTADIITDNANNVGGIIGATSTQSGTFVINPTEHVIRYNHFYGSIYARSNNNTAHLNIGNILGYAEESNSSLAYKMLHMHNNKVRSGYIIGRAPGSITCGGIVGYIEKNTTVDNKGTLRQEFIDLHSSGGQSVKKGPIAGQGSVGSNDVSFVTPISL